MEQFRQLEAMPVEVTFEGEDVVAELFLQKRAKWHKACHLKFSQSKLKRVLEQKKRKREPSPTMVDTTERKSKRLALSTPDEKGCIFCSQISGTLHLCSTMRLDSRMCIHVKDALQKGARIILIRTVDTDVVVIFTSVFFNLQDTYPDIQVWVGFGNGKYFRYYFINDICQMLGREKSRALPFFHAFTGCDTTSHVFRKGEKDCLGILEFLSNGY